MSPLKVFVSSTYFDLTEYRQRAIEVINRYGCIPIAMEHFMAKPDEPKVVCADKITECDVFVGIYAHRYGFIPDGDKTAITQQEYVLAKQLKKDCLCFIVAENFPWNPELCEYKKYNKLQSFIKTIKKENTFVAFTTATDFDAKLASSLHLLLASKEQIAKSQEPAAKSQTLIPPRSHALHCPPVPAATKLYGTGSGKIHALQLVL